MSALAEPNAYSLLEKLFFYFHYRKPLNKGAISSLKIFDFASHSTNYRAKSLNLPAFGSSFRSESINFHPKNTLAPCENPSEIHNGPIQAQE